MKELKKKAPEEGSAANLPNGDDFYKARLKHHTTTEITADEVYSIGLSEVARIQKEMKVLMQKIGFKSDDLKIFPSMVSNSKSGAAAPTRGGGLAMPDKKKLKKIIKINLDSIEGLKTGSSECLFRQHAYPRRAKA